MYNIIIVGAGGFGREVYTWIQSGSKLDVENYRIKGFLSNNPQDLKAFKMEVGILGHENNYKIESNDRFIVAIGNTQVKKRVVAFLKNRGAQFCSLIHHSAFVAETAQIGEGVIICPFAMVSCDVQIDDFAMINVHACCGHDTKVGKYAILSPYAILNGFSIIEEDVFLGVHAAVAAYRTIGHHSKINANSVAMYDVPPHSFVYGVPGKVKTIYI